MLGLESRNPRFGECSCFDLRPAQDAEALALSILKGEPLVLEGVVTSTQQAYVDLRGQEPHTGLDHPDGRGSSSAGPILRRVPEEAEDDEGAESDTIGGIDFRNLETPLYSPRISVSRGMSDLDSELSWSQKV